MTDFCSFLGMLNYKVFDFLFLFFCSSLIDHEDEGNQEVPSRYNIYKHGNNSSRSSHQSLNSSGSLPSSQKPRQAVSATDYNWQQSCKSVRERNAVMFNSDLMADCFFVVGSLPKTQRIPAHKYVLATGSTVFFTMFYGSLADQEDSQKDIEIPDVEPAAFLNMLK